MTIPAEGLTKRLREYAEAGYLSRSAAACMFAAATRIEELEARGWHFADPTGPALHPGAGRAEWHDKAWALFHAKTFKDTMLHKVNIHTMRAVFDATYDALTTAPPASRFSRNEAREEGYREGLAAMREMAAKACDERARLRTGEEGWDMPGSSNWTKIHEAKRCRDTIKALPTGDEGKPAS